MTEGERTLREYLEACAEQSQSPAMAKIHRWLMDNGVVFVGRESSNKRRGLRAWKKKRETWLLGRAKLSYRTASMVAIDGLADYYEGYVLMENTPIHHAWNVYEGQVIDITLEEFDRELKRLGITAKHPVPYIYIGYPVDTKALWSKCLERGYWGEVLFDIVLSQV